MSPTSLHLLLLPVLAAATVEPLETTLPPSTDAFSESMRAMGWWWVEGPQEPNQKAWASCSNATTIHLIVFNDDASAATVSIADAALGFAPDDTLRVLDVGNRASSAGLEMNNVNADVPAHGQALLTISSQWDNRRCKDKHA